MICETHCTTGLHRLQMESLPNSWHSCSESSFAALFLHNLCICGLVPKDDKAFRQNVYLLITVYLQAIRDLGQNAYSTTEAEGRAQGRQRGRVALWPQSSAVSAALQCLSLIVLEQVACTLKVLYFRSFRSLLVAGQMMQIARGALGMGMGTLE